jgi:hypothetical protein
MSRSARSASTAVRRLRRRRGPWRGRRGRLRAGRRGRSRTGRRSRSRARRRRWPGSAPRCRLSGDAQGERHSNEASDLQHLAQGRLHVAPRRIEGWSLLSITAQSAEIRIISLRPVPIFPRQRSHRRARHCSSDRDTSWSEVRITPSTTRFLCHLRVILLDLEAEQLEDPTSTTVHIEG